MKNKKLISIISSVIVIIALVIAGDYSGAFDSFMELLSDEGAYVEQREPVEVSEDSTLEVHFIDVGQADAIVIIQEEHAMLVDAGENETGEEVIEYIKALGITEFDYAVGTHPHSDHIGGMENILQGRFSPNSRPRQ